MSSPSASRSEEHGLEALPTDALRIYSVGVSTAGVAEIRMAKANPRRRVVATTIDEGGLVASQTFVHDQGFANQIEIKIEDVAKPLPYANESFDYVYARLVLHYLTRQQLEVALRELYRVLKTGGKLFVVVRSTNNIDFTQNATDHNKETGITTFVARPNKDITEVRKRYFHTQESISRYVTEPGFRIEHIMAYNEKLFHDYHRAITVDHTDNLIELLAVK
jgi:ubiquinone/menaquinone biosynthesis C-methylase UbiE